LATVLLAGPSGAVALDRGGAVATAGAVPPGATATSVTFVSAQEAFVLGTAPCTHHPCSAILRTLDRGHSWVGLPAPLEAVSHSEGPGLWGLRFADPQRGYAYGNGIWQTLDGSSSWQRWSVPGRYVLDFAAVRDRELVAVTTTCTPASSRCLHRLTVYHRPVVGGGWRRIGSSAGRGFNESIATGGKTVWVLIGQRLFVSADGGLTFSRHSQPCSTMPFGLPQPTSLATSGRSTYLMCTGQGFLSHTEKFIYRTLGLHSGWALMGRAPDLGDAGTIAAAAHRAVVLATASAASWLYRSRDAGRHWGKALNYPDGGIGWGDLGFTTGSDGTVIHGPADTDGGSLDRPGKLLLTDDGGRTWRVVVF
jgi:photosystem II stability/assembly factor-like uncharacterized protein